MYSMPPSFAIFLFFRLHRRLQEDLQTIIVTPCYDCITHIAFYLIGPEQAGETCFPITENLILANFFRFDCVVSLGHIECLSRQILQSRARLSPMCEFVALPNARKNAFKETF